MEGDEMPRRKKYPQLRVAANMPPLYHTMPGKPYHYKNSEVLEWLSKRPALIEYLFSQASNSKDIFYDPSTGKWRGVNYEEDDE
jgi:hypothetical protein